MHRPPAEPTDQDLPRERSELLRQLEGWLEWPLTILGLLWLVLLVIELVHGLDPFFIRVGEVIWIIFIADFLLRLAVAPSKGTFVKNNWLTVIALIIPALRALRFLRVLRALRGVRLVRIVGSINRGMNALGRSMGRRGLPYVLALTAIVVFTGAAGMYAFERGSASEPGLRSYTEALWWTAMLLTTIGSEYWPHSPEGRALTLILSLYALGILGYITASLASFFIGREAESTDGAVAGEAALRELAAEVASLRSELEQQRRA